MTPRRERAPTLALLDDYDFELPDDRIAQTPAKRREEARLLVLERASGRIVASDDALCVRDLPRFLRPGDLLVVNATRVLPAKLRGRKASGGAAEALLLGPEPDPADAPAAARYRALVKCRGRLRVGLELVFGEGEPGGGARIEALHERGEVTLAFAEGVDPYAFGEAPLPPYIRRRDAALRDADLERYQTVYARAPGAVAAPTAGLHLTRALLDRLREKGVDVASVVLHVGAGTFRPLDAEALASGRLHAERFVLPEATARAVAETRRRGGRVIAVGTTTARVLESRAEPDGTLVPGEGETELFLRPGGPPIRVIDGLLTNFHLPRSSLLLLVAALVGRAPLLAAYAHAIAHGYRFYSYGDAMLILPVDTATGEERPDAG
jgi:S-adenosylmethionine:tRNA ribosyltransferase-isomerase